MKLKQSFIDAAMPWAVGGAVVIIGLVWAAQKAEAAAQAVGQAVNPANPDNVVRGVLGIERGGKVDQALYRVFEAVGL